MGLAESTGRSLRKHLNFYRLHILYMIFTPLLLSVVLYASNGANPMSYIDCLFNSVSAMTVCGLATVDLSALTSWQQVILFLQMCLGSPVFVSWFIVYFRRHYFAKKFEHIIQRQAFKRTTTTIEHPVHARTSWARRVKAFFSTVKDEATRSGSPEEKPHHTTPTTTIRPDMIRRVDGAPKLVDPSGWISQGASEDNHSDVQRHLSFADPGVISPERIRRSVERSIPTILSRRLSRRMSDPGALSVPTAKSAPLSRFETVSPTVASFPRQALSSVSPSFPHNRGRHMPRTQTIEFAPNLRRRGRQDRSISDVPSIDRSSVHSRERRRPSHGVPLSTYTTTYTNPHTHRSLPDRRAKNSGFGGFPMPHEIIGSLLHRIAPKFKRTLTRKLTIPATTTLASHGGELRDGARTVPYISSLTVVGRNSAFHLMDHTQMEELGGVEFRALNALLWIIPAYHIGIQLFGFIVIAPYMATRFQDAFVPPALHRPLSSTWFALFQVISAYTNTGMSLVDQSMVPFQTAYPMIVIVIFLILAGNTAYPIFLRFTIWIISKVVPGASRLNETLHFLLDHPRRCYIYLFPSYQTWFLLTIIVLLNSCDWFFFMVLDIGTPAIEAVDLGTRFIVGLIQGVAVRAAGFSVVPLSALAPAVRVLYVLMMYVSVYPIAMSVRSTNVYEEQSLGVFHHDDPDPDDQVEGFEASGSRMTVWSRYLTLHARRQLSFDMWWICLALFLLCIIERDKLDDDVNFGWFNIFSLIFELVSAYGTVGLSLGLPTSNYSFAGALHPLSKLIVTLVMIRGRHRGLPVAIDRAILLPSEFDNNGEDPREPEDEEFEEFEDIPPRNEKLPDIGERPTPGPTPRPSITINDIPLSPTRTREATR